MIHVAQDTILSTSSTESIVANSSTDSVLIQGTSSNVVCAVEDSNVLIERGSDSLLVTGLLGPAGTAGIPGASTQFVYFSAGVPLGGNRAVAVNSAGALVYPDTSLDTTVVVGVTTHAANMGDMVEVQICGVMTEPSWTWTPGEPLFVATNGLLTHSYPSSGVALILAFAIQVDKIFIDKQIPIRLG